jgi:hypothetical protein
MKTLSFALALTWLLSGCEEPFSLTPFPRDAGRLETDARIGKSPAGGRDAQAGPRRPAATPVEDDGPVTVSEAEAETQAETETETSDAAVGSAERSSSRFGVARDPGCDLNGSWAARNTVINQTSLAGPLRVATWHFLVLSQTGDEATVIEHHECGSLARSSAEQSIPRDTLEVLVTKNSWQGRRVRIERVGERCEIAFERAWAVRGADPDTYLPAGRFAEGGLSVQTEPLPSKQKPDGAENWNGSTTGLARPGLAGTITGAANATRWTTQRAYTEWFSNERYPVQAESDRSGLVLAVRYDAEVNVLSVEPPNPLLENLETETDGDNPDNQAELLFVGRDEDRLGKVVVAETDRVKRCLTIQNQLLPY